MRVGILGTGTMAAALAQGWHRTGHTVVVGGRSADKAANIAETIGVSAAPLDEVARGAEAVVVAVAWEGVEETLRAAGTLDGVTILDCTNPVDFATGVLRPATGSAAAHIARIAPGARVVKALHLYAGQSWLAPTASDAPPRVVAMCGDDPAALDTVGALVRDLGGTPTVVGGLDRARQLEEVAGFVVRLVGSGIDPVTAIPAVPRM